MGITRGALDFDRGFTRLPNEWVRDERLSWKARGLLAYLMSHSEGWSTSIRDLERHGPDGRDSIRAGIAELEAAGYLVREQGRDRDNRFVEAEYVITDPSNVPMTGNPTTGNPTTENPSTYKKNSEAVEQSPEHEQQPASADQQNQSDAREYQVVPDRTGLASYRQMVMLGDLWKASGRWVTEEQVAGWRKLSIAEADTEIKALRRERERYA